jgi:hypothetical protein
MYVCMYVCVTSKRVFEHVGFDMRVLVQLSVLEHICETMHTWVCVARLSMRSALTGC